VRCDETGSVFEDEEMQRPFLFFFLIDVFGYDGKKRNNERWVVYFITIVKKDEEEILLSTLRARLKSGLNLDLML